VTGAGTGSGPGSAPPPIVWQPAFDLGVEDIDLQHHYFANLINRLALDFRTVQDASLRLSMLAELNAYARFHFVSEENLMARAAYPGLAAHRAHHLRLIDELSHREGRMILATDASDAGPVLAFLVQWFMGHTRHEDRQFADFLHGRPAA
jgi:hemerythrin-like metal-binding protein